ncbi:MAG: GAF domain-containing protein [Bradymonadales bacterium]|nr:GAF domain-containing protein [Bradymonadales bacterium]
MKRLAQLDGDRVVRQINLEKDRYTLGRGLDNDIVLDIKKVSRHHAVLVADGDTYTVIDQDSVNHVFVNGEEVERKRLVPGDTIQLSRNVTLLFQEVSTEGEALTPSMVRLVRLFGKDGFQRIQEVTNRIISLDSLDNILAVILQTVIRLVGADRGFIALTDEEGIIRKESSISHRIALDSDSSRRAIFSQSIVQQAIHTRKSVFILSTVDEAVPITTSIEELRLRSIMCAPLLFSNRPVGVLYVDSGSKLTNFTETDQLLFTMLANHAAIAIENARRYSQIQRSVVQLKGEVQESEERYRQLIDLMPDAILVHSDGNLLFANQSAVRLLQFDSQAQLLAKRLDELVHPDHRPAVNDRIAQWKQQKPTSSRLEARLLRSDGSAFAVEALFTPLTYQGVPAQLLLIRDITERKKVEEIFTRTEKLESIGLLAGGIAHDFNNILSVILGNLSLVRSGTDDPQEREQLIVEAEEAARRARDLTHQLLTFSRGGSPVKTSGSIAEVVQETASFALRGSNVSGDFAQIKPCPPIPFDEGQISQVINNLIINAVQAMPEGGRVEVGCEVIEMGPEEGLPLPAGPYIRIRVADRGVGIPKEQLSRIFDPYFTTKQKGSGLGLAIAHSIMTRHDGCITVDSESGSGTTFLLYLPATATRETPREIRPIAPKPGTGKVLLMDDEEMIRTTGARMLRSLGYECATVSDGEETLREYHKAMEAGQPFDLVIMDLTVPGGLGGKEAIQKLVSIDPAVRVLVSSGYSNDPIMANYKIHGFVGVLEKPYDLENLAEGVQAALQRHRGRTFDTPQ